MGSYSFDPRTGWGPVFRDEVDDPRFLELNLTELRAMIVIRVNVDGKTGLAEIGHANLAKLIDRNPRTSKRVVASLETKGWIKIHKAGGRNNCNRYEVLAIRIISKGDTQADTVSNANGCQPKPDSVTSLASNSAAQAVTRSVVQRVHSGSESCGKPMTTDPDDEKNRVFKDLQARADRNVNGHAAHRVGAVLRANGSFLLGPREHRTSIRIPDAEQVESEKLLANISGLKPSDAHDLAGFAPISVIRDTVQQLERQRAKGTEISNPGGYLRRCLQNWKRVDL